MLLVSEVGTDLWDQACHLWGPTLTPDEQCWDRVRCLVVWEGHIWDWPPCPQPTGSAAGPQLRPAAPKSTSSQNAEGSLRPCRARAAQSAFPGRWPHLPRSAQGPCPVSRAAAASSAPFLPGRPSLQLLLPPPGHCAQHTEKRSCFSGHKVNRKSQSVNTHISKECLFLNSSE